MISGIAGGAAAYPQLTLLVGDAQLLNDYAVRYRYPGIDATRNNRRWPPKPPAGCGATILPLLTK